jgi:hypothetical protein
VSDTHGARSARAGLTREELGTVAAINNKQTYPYLLNIHYARRIPSITYAFGLFQAGELVGVVTYGTPPSPTLRKGVAGPDWADKVLELNRLVLRHNRPNEASFLVSNSLKLLPRPRIVVSYADATQGHEGYVYRATNFLYTGLIINNRPAYLLHSEPNTQHVTVCDRYRQAKGRDASLSKAALTAFYGQDLYVGRFPNKHRYIMLLGSRTEKRRAQAALRYSTQPYPDAPAEPLRKSA